MKRCFVRASQVSGLLMTMCWGLGLTSVSSASENFEPHANARITPLSLEDVKESAIESFPLIRAFELEKDLRREEALSKDGAFDTRFSLGGEVRPLGFYENWTGSGELEQPTPLWGSRFYSKYRYGEGDFPSYSGDRLTDTAGELSLGVEIPLLRGGSIDRSRAAIQRAALDRSSFAPEFEFERIQLIRAASVAYWNWVASGRVIDVVRSLLEVAEARQNQIVRRVGEGSEAEINLVDNQRLVIERRSRLRGAERDFKQAMLTLSLFLRDDEGNRLLARKAWLPPVFPDEELIADARIERDLQRAMHEHPRLRELSIERERLLLELRLARNDVLPSLNLGLEGARDFGGSRPGIDERGKLSRDARSATEVRFRMRLEFPVQQREARGRLGVAHIRLNQLDRKIQFARAEIETEAKIALEALEAAFEQTLFARENADLAEVLRAAEDRKLRAGLSNMIDLNIRENQAASAAQGLVRAQQDYFRALAEYEARVARDV